MITWLKDLNETGTLPTKSDILTVMRMPELWDDRIKSRWYYLENYSFPLMTQEVAADMAKFFSGKTVLEVCAGSGYVAKCVKDVAGDDVTFICTDNLDWENNSQEDIYGAWRNHYIDIEALDALEAIDKYGDQADYVMVSWPEYQSPLAKQILEKCLEKKLPLVYIGEDWGGCTGDDSFFELVDEKCEMLKETITTNYLPFEGIHDRIWLIRPKQTGITTEQLHELYERRGMTGFRPV